MIRLFTSRLAPAGRKNNGPNAALNVAPNGEFAVGAKNRNGPILLIAESMVLPQNKKRVY